MSERTHSPEDTPQGQSVGEFTQPASPAPKRRFSKRQKLAFLAGGTIALAAMAIGLFQFLKQDEAKAQTGQQAAPDNAQNGGTKRPLARVGKDVIPWEVVAEECMLRYGDEALE